MKRIVTILFILATITAKSQITVVTLNGSSSSDPEGKPLKYKWSQVGNTPLPCKITNDTMATTTVVPANNLQWQPGIYSFQLTVTDDQGATASDIMNVTVTSSPPSVDAGASQTATLPVASITLRATARATVGKVTWNWAQISGPATLGFNRKDTSTVALSNINTPGTYMFRVTLSDSYGSSATDTVTVTIKAANQTPISNAGQDQTITLPQSSAMIGTDDKPAGLAVQWKKISGPAGDRIQSPTSPRTMITGLTKGQFVYQKTVTDEQGRSATDYITLTVRKCSWIRQLFGGC
jgi:hypothetical protein